MPIRTAARSHLGPVSAPPAKLEFVGSFPGLAKAPPPSVPEFAFIGRSNVGKSSLINAVGGRRDLAKTSSTPGKTQMLNIFDIEGRWRLVDLPGYGYARVSKKHRASLREMIETYLARRRSLHCAFVLLDASIPLQDIDREMIRWLAERGLPQAWVFTKADKGRTRQTQSHMAATREALATDWEECPPIFATSAEKNEGTEALVAYIEASLPAS